MLFVASLCLRAPVVQPAPPLAARLPSPFCCVPSEPAASPSPPSPPPLPPSLLPAALHHPLAQMGVCLAGYGLHVAVLSRRHLAIGSLRVGLDTLAGLAVLGAAARHRTARGAGAVPAWLLGEVDPTDGSDAGRHCLDLRSEPKAAKLRTAATAAVTLVAPLLFGAVSSFFEALPHCLGQPSPSPLTPTRPGPRRCSTRWWHWVCLSLVPQWWVRAWCSSKAHAHTMLSEHRVQPPHLPQPASIGAIYLLLVKLMAARHNQPGRPFFGAGGWAPMERGVLPNMRGPSPPPRPLARCGGGWRLLGCCRCSAATSRQSASSTSWSRSIRWSANTRRPLARLVASSASLCSPALDFRAPSCSAHPALGRCTRRSCLSSTTPLRAWSRSSPTRATARPFR